MPIPEKLYSTYEEASQAVQRLGIKSEKEYSKRHTEDGRLPVHPKRYYRDFPGWKVFFGRRSSTKPQGWLGHYPTYQEASQAAQRLDIPRRKEYYERYREDIRFPARPQDFYRDFPGWLVFLGRK